MEDNNLGKKHLIQVIRGLQCFDSSEIIYPSESHIQKQQVA